ncbi:MAG: hypothetical protein ABIQ11_08330 [Saprospiraceae bacterium]
MKHLLIIALSLSLDLVVAQTTAPVIPVPEVFLIGEYEDQYMRLSKEHPAIFMYVYNNDIDKAFRGYSEMLMDMEDYAAELNFDTKGVKLWINLYFNADGSLEHLAFYPKPNSRNVKVEYLAAFFKNFVRTYQLSAKSLKPFHHSASASFPTFFSRELQETAKRN